MDFSFGLLRTRVARRVLLLFVLCALGPVTLLAAISYSHVRGQLEDQSRDRLAEISKNAGMAVMERLLFLDGKLTILASMLADGSGELRPDAFPRPDARTVEGFRTVTLSPDGEPSIPLLGRDEAGTRDERSAPPPEPGGTRLRIVGDGGGPARVILEHRLADVPATLVARVDDEFLWSTALAYANLPSTAGICVVAEGGPPLLCTVPEPERFRELLVEDGSGSTGRGTRTWRTAGGDEHLVGRWSLFLEPAFGAPTLHLGVTETRATVLAPMENFEQTFLAIVGIALLAVLLLGNHQIQQRLQPVAEMRDATEKVAHRQFGVRLELQSGDEFEELAASFNTMARRLGSQFHALNTIAEIDRAILSALDTETIARTVLDRIADVVPCEQTGVCVLREEEEGNARRTADLYLAGPDDRERPTTRTVELTPEDVEVLERGRSRVFLATDEDLPPLAQHLPPRPTDPVEVILAPILLGDAPAGALLLGHHLPVEYEADDLERVRQIADQMAVALSNARLLDDLEKMNRGAFTALARTIDAKSPWTAGHSERVAELAVRLARELDLGEEARATLHRGGLLHDIGKLAIPATILDKPGSLDADERSLIESHVEVGARILEPVPALSSTLPIVLHHHERWDGKGYPHGLAGEAIPLLARVTAVADTYDALTSKRPYRPGLDPEQATAFIRRGAGTAFDPRIADVFVRELGTGDGQTQVPTEVVSRQEVSP